MKIPHFVLPFALLLAATSASFSATVTFSNTVVNPADTTGSFLDLPFAGGSILNAVSFGPARTPTFTYNAPTASSNPNPAPTLNTIAFTSNQSLTGSNFTVGQSAGGSVGFDSGRFSNVSNTNQPLFGLVYDVARSSGNNIRLTINLTNLTIGTSYEVQMIFSELQNADQPANNPTDRQIRIAAGTFTQGTNEQAFNGSGADGNSQTYNYGPVTGVQVVKATFVATSSTELFSTMTGTTGGFSRASLAGLVITTVPEPSTYGVAFAGMLGLLVLARKRALRKASSL